MTSGGGDARAADTVRNIFTGYHTSGHIQGIAVDAKRGYIYCSFTTELIKLDMAGNIVGSVRGLVGHLGCLDFCEGDGRVYGSLEFKNDAIGAGILARTGRESVTNAFYAAVFDGERIVRTGMDAASDGVMTAVYLRDVVSDYLAPGHRFGCSGIDGTAFGPAFGSRDGREYLNIAYGIYGDTSRADNDCQVIAHYDTSDWVRYERPLDQDNMHTSGPDACGAKYFVRTGNTTYGVQNLEYDSFTGDWFAAVYPGEKPCFPNYPMYVISGASAPEKRDIPGYGEVDSLALAGWGETDAASGVSGMRFPHGSTGMASLGDGYWYFSVDRRTENGAYCSDIILYKWDNGEFKPVSAR